MARRKLPGKAWFEFKLFGLQWRVRIIPALHKELDKGRTFGFCCFDRRLVGLSDTLSNEQLRTTLAHELQHIIEEHADVNYESQASAEGADRCTDQVARGWLYVIRDCPEIVALLRDEKPKGT